MPSKYKINDHGAPHFITLAVVEWVDALSRTVYKDIVMESLKFCPRGALITNASGPTTQQHNDTPKRPTDTLQNHQKPPFKYFKKPTHKIEIPFLILSKY